MHWGHTVAHLCMGGTGRMRGRVHKGKLHGGSLRMHCVHVVAICMGGCARRAR